MTRFYAGINRRILTTAAAWWLVCASPSLAANDFWKAAVNGVWGDGANWADGTRPEGGDQAFFNLAGAYTVTFLADPFPIQALTVTGAGNVTFASNSVFQLSTLRVTSASGSQDVLVTNDATLTLGVPGSLFQPDRPLHLTAGDELNVQNGATLNVGFGSDVVTHVLNVASGGQLNVNGSGSTLTNDTYLTVGTAVSGSAFMTIQNGATVFNNVSYVGGGATSMGTMTVTGAGSTWTNSNWIVVGAGNGQMIVQDGGSVTSFSGTLGWTAGSSGTVGVSGAGSTWTIGDFLSVGESGMGQMTISDGGSVANAAGILGLNPGASGAVTVTGAGSTWTNSGGLYVGQNDAGSLTIQDGGSVSNTFGRVGWSSFSNSSGVTSTATVAGGGSTWTNSGDLVVGGYSKGSMTISGGGTVSSTSGSIGFGAAPSGELANVLLVGNGAVTVTGAGSTWTNAGELNVGSQGTGALAIEAGGSVSSTNGFIGRYADLSHPNPAYRYSSTGTATVTGAGSTWTMSGRLSMGGDAATGVNGGTGTLTIGPDGAVNVAQDTVLFPGSLLKLEGGSFATTAFGFQGGQFQWTSGTLHIDTFNGNLTNPNGGTLAPGRSVGSTMIAGSYTQQSGAALEIEIGGTALALHDFVNVSATAFLGGELQLKLIGGFMPSATDSFTLLNALGGIAGVFSNVATGQRLTTIDGNGSFLVHYGATSAFNPNQIVLTAFELTSPLVPGDFDGDGDVDGADFVIWQTNFPKPNGGTLATGDADGDGDVDGADFVVWQTNFPFTPSPSVAPVPEPRASLLAALATIGIAGVRLVRGTRREAGS